MSGLGGVGGMGRPVDLGTAEPIPEPVSTTPSNTSLRPVDNFERWTTQKVAIAADGGPATINGLFNRSVFGSITIRNGQATFTRRVFNQPEEAPRKLGEREKADLAKALEREIAAGGSNAQDLRYVLSQLKQASGPATGPDLPGPILTEAIGEFGRAVAGMVADRLKAENDDGLDRTLRAFVQSMQGAPQGQAYDFHAVLGGLKDKGVLDDLALELLVKDREFVATHPNVRYYGTHQLLSDAVKRHCTPEMQKVWTDATKQAERSIGTGAQKNAKAAGLEAARELELGLETNNLELMMRAARRLTEGVEVRRTRPLTYEANDFVKARLNTAIKRLTEDAKLNDVVEKLAGSRGGAMALSNLHAVIQGVGNKTTKADWKAAGGREVATMTTMAVGEEGRGPGIP